jgi:hypothetical protein
LLWGIASPGPNFLGINGGRFGRLGKYSGIYLSMRILAMLKIVRETGQFFSCYDAILRLFGCGPDSDNRGCLIQVHVHVRRRNRFKLCLFKQETYPSDAIELMVS